jgi:APA family basic amino acid/polyamine antiporter
LKTHELKRVIGVPGVAFTAFNCIVGVGIFGLPALVATLLGTAAIVAYGVCLVLIALVGLCFAEAGSRVRDSGGIYSYAEAAFGPVVGGVTGVLLLFANSVGSSAALARFFLDTLGTMSPTLASSGAGIVILCVIYTVLATVNILGARDGSRLTIAIGILKLTPLILLVAVGVFHIQHANLTWPGFPAVSKVGEAALILVFAFIGVESGLNVSGETRDPARTIPRAIALALGMVAVLYIGLQATTQGVLGPALATSKAPLVDTARAVFGAPAGHWFAVLTLFSAGGYLVADTLSSPRVGFALARAGQMPGWLGYVHPERRTPVAAIILYAVLVVVVTASGTFRQIAVLATAGTLLLYLIACLSVLRLRTKGIAGNGTPFVAPGGAVVPLAASAIIVWLLSTLAWNELVATLVFVLVATIIYALVHRRPTGTPDVVA